MLRASTSPWADPCAVQGVQLGPHVVHERLVDTAGDLVDRYGVHPALDQHPGSVPNGPGEHHGRGANTCGHGHGAHAGLVLDLPNGGAQVGPADPPPPERLGNGNGRPAAAERVQHYVAGVTASVDDTF